MHIGASVGPYVDRIDALPASLAFVEIAIGEGELSLDDLDTDAVSARLRARGFDTIVHLPYRQPLSTPIDRIDDATLSYLDDALGAAAAIGAETAVVHPSARGAGHATERLADRIAELAERGRTHGITVCLETVGYAGGVDLDRVGRLADRSDAAVCLDVGYAFLEAGTDGISAFLDAHGDRVEHVHAHGVRRRGDTHIPIGSGDVEYGPIGDALAETVPDATATIEVFTDDPEYVALSVERFRAAVGEN
jgi:sugar phosphate isomerase/epimerase